MCCHEGVDKPPKPPKTVAPPQPAPASGKNNAGTCRGSGFPPPVQMKLQMDKSNNPCPKPRIESIDLAQDSDRGDYAKVGTRNYRNLHQLHEKVARASPMPTIARTEPLSSCSQGEKLKLSFLSKGVDAANHSGKTSSDYDDDGMDDLHSPSTLLGQKKSAGLTTHGGSGNVTENLAFDKDISDIEANMIGLGDSFDLKDSSIHGEGNCALLKQDERLDAIVSNYEDNDITWDLPVSPSPHGPHRKPCKQDKAEKLFLSTESPEKPTSGPLKRKITSSFDVEVSTSSTTPLPKKAKREDREFDAQETSLDGNQAVARDLPPASLSSVEVQGPPPKPTIRPGYPNWVYDLDPEFVAEYEDYVEFV